ncbi:MAG: pseudouridine synthase [Gammaproteobacteria bacterium]|nr:pseudouridine synthase [Gammaproteobacteria bacterium]
MGSHSSRLDKLISQHTGMNKREIKLTLARQQVWVDDTICTEADRLIGQFTKVVVEDQIIQDAKPVYVLLNKPKGAVSATKDPNHQTVVDLLPSCFSNLHIAGRLDRQSTGLLLLTNDGEWSRRITCPTKKLDKYYRVTLQNAIDDDCIEAFAQGMYFAYEDIITAPALLDIVDEYMAEVVLTEGKYHQIKRMFGRFRNPVLSLHRWRIGGLALPKSLSIGSYRVLSKTQAEAVFETK